jgi:hypothetical protein
MRWVMLNLVPLINMFGLLCDIVGAFFVESEVVRQFRGMQYGASPTFDTSFSGPPQETPEYKKWSHLKTRNMKLGLGLLVIGFLLQIVANASQFEMP